MVNGTFCARKRPLAFAKGWPNALCPRILKTHDIIWIKYHSHLLFQRVASHKIRLLAQSPSIHSLLNFHFQDDAFRPRVYFYTEVDPEGATDGRRRQRRQNLEPRPKTQGERKQTEVIAIVSGREMRLRASSSSAPHYTRT